MTEPHIDYCHMGPWPIYVGFTTSKKAFAKEMKRLDLGKVDFLARSSANATTHHLHAEDGAPCCVITLDKTGGAIEQIASMIAHEAVHVAQYAFEQFGEENPGRESEAYFVQHIVQFCLQIALDTGRVRKSAP
jgi:hypothetical protein